MTNTPIETIDQSCTATKSTAMTSEYKISPNLSAFSQRPQLSKTSINENICSTEMKFSAQNGESQDKNKNAQNSFLKIQQLIQEQRSKMAANKTAPSKKVDFQKLITLLNTKKQGNAPHKIEEPLSGKSITKSATKMFGGISGPTKILQPSLLGNPKFYENLQNIMNQRRIVNQSSTNVTNGLTRISNLNNLASECSEASSDSKQKKDGQLNISQLQLILNQSSSPLEPLEHQASAPKQLLGKRKRKTERELKILRNELKKNLMWTRESIKVMRARYEKDFEMSEQQIYKWWWDQTRKRSKKTTKKGIDSDLENLDPEPTKQCDEFLVSFQDEFGGYSSRLRINQEKIVEADLDQNVELNLCELLGIDVEGIAYRLAMEDEELETSDIHHTSPVSEHDRNLEENAMRLQMLMDFETKSERPSKRQRTAAVSYSTQDSQL